MARRFGLAALASLGIGWGAPAGGCGGDATLRVTPSTVGLAGGARIRIEGDDFVGHGPVAVYVGSEAAKAIVIESPWLVTAVVPPLESRGTVDVQLSFGDGTTLQIAGALTIEEQAAVVLSPGASRSPP